MCFLCFFGGEGFRLFGVFLFVFCCCFFFFGGGGGGGGIANELAKCTIF